MSKHKEFEEYRALVVAWAESRGIFEQATPINQNIKTVEELGELSDALVANDHPKIKDAIGDTMITLIIHWEMHARSVGRAVSEDSPAFVFTEPMFLERETGRCERFLQELEEETAKHPVVAGFVSENFRRLSYVKRVWPVVERLTVRIDNELQADPLDYAAISTGIRHVVSCLWLAAIAFGWHLTDCIGAAWEEIKDRKGKMVDGMFIDEPVCLPDEEINKGAGADE